jgi:uncharacterized protein YbjT (DUF2867 family)
VKALVIGGTGTVGSQVARGLLERGESVRVLTRSAGKSRDLPPGAEGAVGDLADPRGLPTLFKGVDAVFMATALDPNETEHGLAGVRAAKNAGVKRFVYMSLHIPKGSEHIPHFASKIPIEKELRESGMEWTILRPNSFYQNDLRFREPISAYGVYPQPIGSKGMNRVDVRDIAEAAVNALTQPGHAGQEYPLHGPDAVTGESTAATYSRHLGRQVRYGGDDLDVWEQQARNMMPDWLVDDLRIMYDYFQRQGFRPKDADFARQKKVLGHEPRSFDAFVAELAPTWRG